MVQDLPFAPTIALQQELEDQQVEEALLEAQEEPCQEACSRNSMLLHKMARFQPSGSPGPTNEEHT